MTDSFRDATLIIVGHGSTKNSQSAASVYQHAAELRRRGIFHSVMEAFWKQEPFIKPTLEKTTTSRVFIVPLFISEGYFTQQAIPSELGLLAQDQTSFAPVLTKAIPGQTSSQTIYYTAPVGTHPSMTNALIARARDIIRAYPFPRAPKLKDTALFIAGHGTEQNENSLKSIDHQVERIRATGEFGEVHPLFIEEEPKIPQCYQMTSLNNLVVVPFFISEGMHTAEDIPIMLGEPERVVKQRIAQGQSPWRNPSGKQGKLVWYTRPIGIEPAIADIILERVNDAAKTL